MDIVSDLDWHQIWSHLYHLVIAFILAVPLAGIANKAHTVPASGLFPWWHSDPARISYMLTGIIVLDSTDAEGRVVNGILTGIGFIGGGAILKEKGNVAGDNRGEYLEHRRDRNCRALGPLRNRHGIKRIEFSHVSVYAVVKKEGRSNSFHNDPKMDS
jgi:hypothetical protein